MPEPLTKLERRILDFIVDYLRRNTYQPSIREIGQRFAIKSTKTVSEHLQALADKGWIERDPSRSRGVRILGIDLKPATVTVPIYGADGPGQAPVGLDGVVDDLQLDLRLVGADGVFALPMAGDDMAGAGIRDGDLLIVEPRQAAAVDEGATVVARVGGHVTVRRFHQRGGDPMLESAGQVFPPLVTGVAGAELLGQVVCVLRRVGVPVNAAPAVAAEGSA
jgi:repressor LexA